MTLKSNHDKKQDKRISQKSTKELDFEKLYHTYFVKVYSYVIGMVKDSSAAEEITQNTFVKAMTAKNAYKGLAKEFTWLCSIARNLSYDYFRKEGKTAAFEDEQYDSLESYVDHGNILDQLVQKETSYEIHRILHQLEEPYKEVFSLRVFGELSFGQISSIFGKSESWARVTYHRARMKIKERMGKNGY